MEPKDSLALDSLGPLSHFLQDAFPGISTAQLNVLVHIGTIIKCVWYCWKRNLAEKFAAEALVGTEKNERV
jgi:hypothetical protein